MKVITLIQPWASLIALGEKRIETRSWKTSYRGPLLIHAGKKIDKVALRNPVFIESLRGLDINTMLVGMILAKCELVDCVKVKSIDTVHGKAYTETPRVIVEGKELIFGDYSPGRYLWILDKIEPLKEHIPSKGQLSLWEYPFEEEKQWT